MNPRQAFHALMSFERPASLCQFEWGYWPETLDRWRHEGMPADREPWQACGIATYVRPDVANALYPPFERQVLREDADTRIVRNDWGQVLQESKHGTRFPRFIEHPVRTREDFEALKERLDPAAPGRYAANWPEWIARSRTMTDLLCIGRRENGFFGWLRELMGLENLLMAYIEQPDFIHEMCRYHVGFLQRLWERALRDLQIDFVFMWEDMCYKNGPLMSPAFVREFMLPYYRQMVDFYRQMGARWIVVDSDGDVRQLIGLFLEVGIDGMLPFEVAANLDVREIRRDFPSLRILGGIDKRALIAGPAAIDAELTARLPEMFRAGGYLPTVDHAIPPEVSYENFQYYLRRCRELYAAG